jgi:hypothetical protein
VTVHMGGTNPGGQDPFDLGGQFPLHVHPADPPPRPAPEKRSQGRPEAAVRTDQAGDLRRRAQGRHPRKGQVATDPQFRMRLCHGRRLSEGRPGGEQRGAAQGAGFVGGQHAPVDAGSQTEIVGVNYNSPQ